MDCPTSRLVMKLFSCDEQKLSLTFVLFPFFVSDIKPLGPLKVRDVKSRLNANLLLSARFLNFHVCKREKSRISHDKLAKWWGGDDFSVVLKNYETEKSILFCKSFHHFVFKLKEAEQLSLVKNWRELSPWKLFTFIWLIFYARTW